MSGIVTSYRDAQAEANHTTKQLPTALAGVHISIPVTTETTRAIEVIY